MSEYYAPRLRISEIFHSLQGEARDVGRPTVFVRLTGCPLRCIWCDTEYAFHGGQWRDIDVIATEVATFQTRHVCVTGGEPLAQKRCLDLLKRLCDDGYAVSLETSGALDVAAVDPRVSKVMDLKAPGSGEALRNLWSNLDALGEHDQVKFVLADRADYDWACAVLDEQGLVAALRDAVLTRLRQAGAAGSGRVDSGRPPASADAGAIAQAAVGRSTGALRMGIGKMTSTNAAPRKAVVLVSGGMDSAVTLALAREQGFVCRALSVAYGQRHASELAAAARIAGMLGAIEHKCVQVDLRSIGGSALTADIAVPEQGGNGIPVTYVPARNTIMLAIALGWAEALGAADIFCGVNAVDYSGYPDCRPEFIAQFERLANLATKAGVEGASIRVHAPLIHLSKAEIVSAGMRLGVDFAATVSCYQADADGRACGHCDACRLRAQGFAEAGVGDPTRYR